MLQRRFPGLKIDRVGKIDIRDNVFIGYGAVLMPGVTVGPDAIVDSFIPPAQHHDVRQAAEPHRFVV